MRDWMSWLLGNEDEDSSEAEQNLLRPSMEASILVPASCNCSSHTLATLYRPPMEPGEPGMERGATPDAAPQSVLLLKRKN